MENYIPNHLEENVLETIGILQDRKSDKIISAKEISLLMHDGNYTNRSLISIHNILRKLKLKGLVRMERPNSPTRSNKVGWVLDGRAVKYIFTK